MKGFVVPPATSMGGIRRSKVFIQRPRSSAGTTGTTGTQVPHYQGFPRPTAL